MTEAPPRLNDLPEGLPSDPKALRAFVLEIIVERDAALVRCMKLEHLLLVLATPSTGRSSEKLNAVQLAFMLEDVEQAIAAVEAGKMSEPSQEPRTRRKKTGQSRRTAGAPAADRRDDSARGYALRVLPHANARDRRR